ncbi:FG-GAP-like repeat-containing protein [Luteococcus peritonei]|uniref:FG-GAP-like repeat-containing protein n=1 Tax=Luteococcus peritonei TaxID=88874 RepID=A0ABW4RR06_9ACTN
MSARLRVAALATTLAATGALTLATPAQAAPEARTATVVCDQLGEVELELRGPLDRPGSVAVAGGGAVRVVGTPQVSLSAVSGGVTTDLPGTGGGVACSAARFEAPAGQLASSQVLAKGRLAAAQQARAEVQVRVDFDEQQVLQQAADELREAGTVRAAAVSSNPAGYGAVEAFPYQSQLAGYAKARSGSVAVAYRAEGSSTIYSYAKGSATNVTASIVKVQVMATVMYQAQQQGRGLTAWEKSKIVPMIRNSDNAATSALWDHVGRGPAVKRVLDRMGLRSTTPGPGGYWGLTVTSAPDNVVLVDHFSRSNPVLNATNRAYGLSEMRKVSSAQDWGVTAGPGDDIAMKNGWLPRTDGWHVNSVGYNHKLPRRYSAAVLTHSTSAGMSTQVATIEGLSRIMWGRQVAARGDWTGDGRADLLGIKGGDLYIFRAASNGRLGAPSRIGNGWGGFTWIGNADVTRDGITDLVARDGAGNLQLYRGNGNGTVSHLRRLGWGWGGFTAMTVGDLDGNRTPDLLARTRSGDLVRYTLPTSGYAQKVGRIGYGWNMMNALMSVQGVNNDPLADVMAIGSNRLLYAYTSTGRGLGMRTQVGNGWNASLVASPGDLTGDTIEDIAYLTPQGLTTYPVRRGGSIATPFVNPGSAAGFRLFA